MKSLAAKIEPFDSFWEAPDNLEKGYSSFYNFYKDNYLEYFPKNKSVNILVVSCGAGYMVHTLLKSGYKNIKGIDSCEKKVAYAIKRGLNCHTYSVWEYLSSCQESFEVIFCEQELNHLTKEEILEFLDLVKTKLVKGGALFSHALNGANPITGAEALAQNFDHYNTFTEYTYRQILKFKGFSQIQIFPLNLYVFYKNPVNYILILLDRLYKLFFRFSFLLYGKKNKIFTKKIGCVCRL